jgi:hypothetical protein
MSNTKYTKERLEEAVECCNTYADVARWFGVKPVGGTINNLSRRIRKFNIDTSHFLGKGSRKGKSASNKLTPEEILIVLEDEFSLRQKPSLLRRALIEIGVEYKCSNCKISSWLGKELTLHLDHINGISNDHRLSNLRFLCL